MQEGDICGDWRRMGCGGILVRQRHGKGIAMDPNAERVMVTDVRMSFWSMVVFMVKWAIASIPAFFILGIIWFLVAALFGSIGHMMFIGRY